MLSKRTLLRSIRNTMIGIMPGAIVLGLSDTDFETKVLSSIKNLYDARLIGSHFLKLDHSLNTKGAILVELDKRLAPQNKGDVFAINLNKDTNRDIRQRIRLRISDDYSKGDTVELDGWVFAKTEALIYKLAAIG